MYIGLKDILPDILTAISSNSTEIALQKIIETLVRELNLTGAALFSYSKNKKTYETVIGQIRKSTLIDSFKEISEALNSEHPEGSKIEIFNISEIPSDSLKLRFMEKSNIRTILSYPMIRNKELFGVFHIYSKEDFSPFDPEEIDFGDIVRTLCCLLMEINDLSKESSQKINKLSALYEVSQKANEFINISNATESIFNILKALIEYDICIFYKYDTEKNNLYLDRSQGFDKKDTALFPPVLGIDINSIIGQAAKEKKPILFHYLDYKSFIAVPVIVADNLFGVLSLGSYKSYAYKDDDIISINILASQVASVDSMLNSLIQMRSYTENIIDSMPVAVLALNPDMQITHFNKVAKKMFPVLSAKVSGVPSKSVLASNPEILKMAAETLETNRIYEDYDSMIETRPVKIGCFPYSDSEGEFLGIAILIKDVTEIKALEEQLKRADRLSALGELSAGIAHEIRNPLTGIKMVIQLLQNALGEENPEYEKTTIVISEVDRLEKIVANLLSFARPSTPEFNRTSVETVIENTLFLLGSKIRQHSIELEKNYEQCLPAMIDATQIKQVLFNVILNGIQSMEDGGKLYISTTMRDNFAEICIRDSGHGISTENKSQVFNPFFTTKDSGVGLGLSISHRIIEEHKGYINFQTQSAGTAFFIGLPVSAEEK